MPSILLTIAIPTYNRANLLSDCLSVLAREFAGNSEVEVLVSNNASTDDTADVVAKYSSAILPNLRYFENKFNTGMDENFANCFRQATGKYVWVFSDDDLLMPAYGQSILNLLSSNNWGVVHLKSIWYQEVFPETMPVAMEYQVYAEALSFLHQVHYWVTFLTGNIINKSLLLDNKFSYQFGGTNLIQLGWVLPAVFASHPNAIVTTPVLACRANNTGGYKLFQTFGTAFNSVMAKLVASQAMPAVARRIINQHLITEFFPVFVAANRASFSHEPIMSTLYRVFWRYSSFWTVLMPVYFRAMRQRFSLRVKNYLMRKLATAVHKISQSAEYQQVSTGSHDPLNKKFRSFGANSTLPAQRMVINPQYISIGSGFSALHNFRIEAWDDYAGQKFTPTIEIGDNVVINTDCHIGCINRVIIGNNVLMASRIYISDHSHGEVTAEALSIVPLQRPLISKGPVVIEDNVWIGEGVCILPGVHIGRNAIIGANAVVTKDVPSNAVVGGNPAKIIRQL